MKAILGIFLLFVLSVGNCYAQNSINKSRFVLGPEDILEISVWQDNNLTKQVVILPDGYISFPLIGDIHAAGKTIPELKQEIVKRLKEYIASPVVTVMVVKVNSYKIYIVGKVNKPGVYTLGRHIDVMQALALAGGTTPFADLSHIIILRKEKNKQIKINFNYQEVSEGKDLSQNILLRSGDVIVVP